MLDDQKMLRHLYACDFSAKAIELLKEDPRCTPDRCTAFVADITVPGSLGGSIPTTSLDVLTTIFVLSALPPEKFGPTLENIKSVLKPGGLWLFRDYAVNDAAQLRFKDDNKLTDSLFVRQDGTLSYFFEQGELRELVQAHGFEVVECDYHRSKTTNIKQGLEVERVFLQAKFRLL